jgi:alpha-1,2-rhamnosyltransferase
MINDATDDELNYCYTRAKAVIIASFAEGFGLPLVEALHFGKKVFASDIPVFREIGKEHLVYFSLADPQQLIKKILEYESGDQSMNSEMYVSRSWDESVRDLFQKVVRMADSIEFKKKDDEQ